MGLMTHTRAGLTTRNPQTGRCGWKPTCGAAYGRIRRCIVLQQNRSALTLTDVLKRRNLYFRDLIKVYFSFSLIMSI
jgi:hypothetical protein